MAKLETHLVSSLDAFVGFARKRLNDPELAADAVQDSLLKALKAANPPSDEEKMVPWFYQILRRTIIDIYRRNAVCAESLHELAHEPPELPSDQDAAAICQCFRTLLPTLPQPYRQLLERVDLQGEEPKKVAEALHVTWNNLNVRLYRARAALRKRIEETCRACSVHGCLDCTCGL